MDRKAEDNEKLLMRRSKWEENILFHRKEGKTFTINEMKEHHEELISTRYNEIKEGAEEISQLLSSSNKALKVSKGSPPWKNFVAYVNDIVCDGFVQLVLASLRYLRAQLDPERMAQNETPPLLEVNLELVTPNVMWSPELAETSSGESVKDHFKWWIRTMIESGSFMYRLDKPEETFETALEQHGEVKEEIEKLEALVNENERRCEEFREGYLKYQFLWTRDLNEALQQFLEQNSYGDSMTDLPLQAFDEQIAYYKSVQEEVSGLPSYQNIGYIKVDARPIKQALSTWITKWVFLFTHHLTSKVTNSLDELDQFMNRAFETLNKDPNSESELVAEDSPQHVESPSRDTGKEDTAEQGEETAEKGRESSYWGTEDVSSPQSPRKAVLYEIMSIVHEIRARSVTTETMFEPLEETTNLLHKYGISMPDRVMTRLRDSPTRWETLKDQTESVYQSLEGLREEEEQSIKARAENFAMQVSEFRKDFLNMAPHDIKGEYLSMADVDPALDRMENLFNSQPSEHFKYGGVNGMLSKAAQINHHQKLFDLDISDYSVLNQCKDELNALKEFWQTAGEILRTIDSWKQTPWEETNVEQLIDEAKRLRKSVKAVDKNVRSFEVYKKLDEQVKSLVTSLPLIGELRSPAMRDRHWKQLMRSTGKQLNIEESFTLGELLSLQLHEHSDAVMEIVERANKELVIEKGIKKIEENWASLSLEFVRFEDREVKNIVISDQIWETLENDTIQLQNMSGSRHVLGNEKFQEVVNNWHRKLSTVDSVLTVWQSVAHKWSMLEPVFTGSADIRTKLPEDSQRFDTASSDFEDLMASAPEVKNVVDACNMDGRETRLSNILEQLEQCEKSLQGYLETKRVAFPRFYFVASTDLLDILSKGSNPQLLQPHLSKVFENINKLEFDMSGEDQRHSRTAIGMHSKEGEYVQFENPCECEGQVENYLWTVLERMQEAVHRELVKAINQYDDMPRTKWMLQYCAQCSVAASRTMYTKEVNTAFSRLEEGHENALKDALQKQVRQLDELIQVINGNLGKLERRTALHLCTIDVHNRDVLQNLVDQGVDSEESFQWQSQMRYIQETESKRVRIQISDSDIPYQYEYLGNTGCLVITPLTDRCYITLTQAQRLCLGGAPAGPAGTGKTETVKDLGKALATLVYVFNCSEQMDYKAMGQIYKGLAQTGAWGCFDEFNRIPVAVLSVCSSQYKSVLALLPFAQRRSDLCSSGTRCL